MNLIRLLLVLVPSLTITALGVTAQSFVHPGGLHTQADLDRMKAQVAAGAHPWIDDWKVLITDAQAQNTFKPSPLANLGASRQQADANAHAAYLNAIRWYISGDTSYAACAVRICNAWSSTVNQVPTGTDVPGLSGIPIFDFALAAEVLRIYPGWAAADFARFKNMMTTYFYPVCHNFLTNHNGACISNYWANWDICNLGALIAMGVLCDDTAKYNEGVNYFKNGPGAGSIQNAVYTLQPGNLGQWQESGRDQEHAQLGVGMLDYACQVAWNQGLDLFGYSNNRLLAGAEYVAQTNLWNSVPYSYYNNCANSRQDWISANGRGRLDDRPIWELVYNHYVVQEGLNSPGVQSMAQLMRPEHGSVDHFGYGTLTFTQSAVASPYPPSPVPAVPGAVTATAGVGQVTLQWTASPGNIAQGYVVKRAVTSGGPYTTISSVNDNTTPQYTDWSAVNGTTYHYVVAAVNQSGTSGNSTEASATPMAASAVLPAGWLRKDIGTVGAAGSAGYASVSNNTYLINGSGTGIGGTADGFGYVYGSATGDVTVTARLWRVAGTLSRTGIMFRETLDPNARTLIMKLGDVGGREGGFGIRSATGGSMTVAGGNDYTIVPTWYRLQRSGNTFTGYESSDGNTWFVVDSGTVAMAGTYYIGLAACSGSTTGAVDSSVFDNVTITGGGSAPSAPSIVNGVAVSSSRIRLSWPAAGGVSGYTIQRSRVSGGPYSTVAAGVSDTTYSDGGLSDSTIYYYVVSAANISGASVPSAEVGVQTLPLSLPLAPGGLALTGGKARITLNWTAADATTSYTIKRAAVADGPFVLVGSTDSTIYQDSALTNGATYYYTVSGVNRLGEGAACAPVGLTLPVRLRGVLIGTAGSFGNNAATTKAAAVDGNIATYFDGPQANGDWVGIDLGTDTSALIRRISYVPRSNFPQRMTGGLFQGANQPDFSDAVTFYTVATAPSAGVYTDQQIVDTVRYRYLRYLSPNNGFCNVAEIEFWGNIDTAAAPPQAPTTVVVASDSAGVMLTWTPAVFASSYIIRRAQGGSGSYQLLNTTSATGYQDNTAIKGATYYYTVSGVDAFGEGDVSAPAALIAGARLGGLLTGTSGSFGNNAATTRTAAVDGNIATYFDALQADSAWVGIDLGPDSNAILTQISFAPRSSLPQRMIGGVFQGANKADFSDAVTLFTVAAAPPTGVITPQQIWSSGVYRYLRYLSPDNGFCNVAEVQFWGLANRSQAITFNSLPPELPGNPDFAPGAASSAGLPITYASADTNVATIVNGNIHILAAGTSVITAMQAGDSVYNSAAPVSQLLTVRPLHLQVQYHPGPGDASAGDSSTTTVNPYLKIVNADSIGVSYTELTARYWLTPENYAGIHTWVDYAAPGGGRVRMQYIPLAQPYSGAFGCVQYSFDSTAGVLAAGGNSGEIQSRIANTDWSVMNENNDYSYRKSSAYDTSGHITLYRNGVLVWGTEPVAVAPVLSLRPWYQNQNKNTGTNTISTYLYLDNEGNVPVSYKDIRIRYWFTEDGTAALHYWIDYAKLGGSAITGQFVAVAPARDSADTYFEVAIDSAAGILYPSANSGNIQYRIAKADWSPFYEKNDYSFAPATGSFAVNDHITVYYKGQLVSGVEPGALSDSMGSRYRAARGEAFSAPAPGEAGTSLYPNPVTAQRFIIRARAGLQGKDIKIAMYDLTGKVVFVKMVRDLEGDVIEIGLPLRVAAGVYMVQLNNEPPVKLVVN
jgi:fibronectin type 3 domain-containing protein